MEKHAFQSGEDLTNAIEEAFALPVGQDRPTIYNEEDLATLSDEIRRFHDYLVSRSGFHSEPDALRIVSDGLGQCSMPHLRNLLAATVLNFVWDRSGESLMSKGGRDGRSPARRRAAQFGEARHE